MTRRALLPLLLAALLAGRASAAGDPVEQAAANYFADLFEKLEAVAAQHPDRDTFRAAMQPMAESVEGFFGGSLISPDFVIVQSYYKTHALANGYDLKKVRELDRFRALMRTAPAPQLSEPGRGTLFQPRLISLRAPVMESGEVRHIVSALIRTEAFLRAAGLDRCRAFRIICPGAPAEEKGELSEPFREVRLKLPSTEWVIQYNP